MTDVAEERADWLEWRAGGMGSSDVAAAYTGLYGGAYRAVATRLGIEVDDIDEDLADRGHRWEHAIADGVHAHTGLYVGGEQLWLECAQNHRLRCTPDGLLFTTPEPAAVAEAVGGLECKTLHPRAPWRWLYWIAQSQFAMHVAGLPRWLLAVAVIDTEFDQASAAITPEMITNVRYRMLYADPAMQAELVAIAVDLLGHVDRGELPTPVDPGALPYVQAAHAIADPDATADIDDLADLLSRYDDLRDAEKAAEAERRTAEAQIRARMGAATEAMTADGTWRVRVGAPVRKFTSQSEADFIELHCVHRDDCDPDCTDHRPDMLTATLERSIAKDDMPDEYDALKIPTPDRRLTIKKLTED